MLVIVIAGLLAGIAMPRLRRVSQQMALRGAKNELATSIAVTRGAAVQKGRASRLLVRGSVLTVTVDTTSAAGVPPMTVLSRSLKTDYKVSVLARNPADTLLPFGSRGYARTQSGGTAVYFLTGPGGLTDSVCVSLFGLVSKRGCIQ